MNAASWPTGALELSEATLAREPSCRAAEPAPPQLELEHRKSLPRFPLLDQTQMSWPCKVPLQLLVRLFFRFHIQRFKQADI